MPVYVICFLNFELDNQHPDKYRWDVSLMEKELKEVFYNKLDFIFFEMPKFKLTAADCDTDYKKWLYILNNMDILDYLPPGFNMPVFNKLKEVVDIEKLSLDERMAYDLSWSAYNDYNNTMQFAIEQGLEKGLKQGIEKGLKEGIEEGLKEGKKEGLIIGKTEGIIEERTAIVLAMKKKGIDITIIAEISGLTIEEIEKL